MISMICVLMFLGVSWGQTADRWQAQWGREPACQQSHQSPVNFHLYSAYHDLSKTDVQFNWTTEARPLTIYFQNDGETVFLETDDNTNLGPTTIVDGVPYKLTTMNFRWGSNKEYGSEHSIDEIFYSGEIELYHFREGMENWNRPHYNPGEVLIVSVFIQEDTTVVENFGFEIVKDMIPSIRTPGSFVQMEQNDQPFNIDYLMTGSQFFRYSGSISVTPCSPAERIVFREPVKATPEFFGMMRSVKNNRGELMTSTTNRPRQPIGRKAIFKNFGSVETAPSHLTLP